MTRPGILYGPSTTAPGALTLHCQGRPRTIVRFGAPGAGKSYAYRIDSRISQSTDGDASEWSTTPLDSGTVSGADNEETVISGDYGEIRITCSSPSGGPSYLIHYYLTGS